MIDIITFRARIGTFDVRNKNRVYVSSDIYKDENWEYLSNRKWSLPWCFLMAMTIIFVISYNCAIKYDILLC